MPDRKFTVVHCGTGYVGKMAIDLIGQQPHLKLIGHRVSTPEKAGKDSGELVGLQPNGVITTSSWDEVVALKADVLCYFADSVTREREAIVDVIRFLEAGTNVVTISAWEIGHRKTVPADLMARIDEACLKGNSSVFFTSVDPGWATSEMTYAALAAANRVDTVRMVEFADFTHYTAEYASREYFGFGQPEGFKPTMVTQNMVQQMWAPTLYRIADVLDVPIDEFKTIYETDSVDFDIQTAFGLVKAGTASAVRFELQGLRKGRPFLFLEHVDHVLPDLSLCKKPWNMPNGAHTDYRIEIRGDLDFEVEMQ